MKPWLIATMCEGKERHTPDNARRVAAKMRRKGRYVCAYRCRCCGAWHVGRDNGQGR